MSDDDWNQITATPAGPDTYGRFMRVRDFDCWMHLHDIRDAVAQPAADADLGGPASRLALDEMAASMGFVVGKLAKAPAAGVFPHDFYVTTNQQTFVRIDGKEIEVQPAMMDSAIALDRIEALAVDRQHRHGAAGAGGSGAAIALVAVEHLYFLVLEMFLWTKPTGRRATAGPRTPWACARAPPE